jgi:hypothetical protein
MFAPYVRVRNLFVKEQELQSTMLGSSTPDH